MVLLRSELLLFGNHYTEGNASKQVVNEGWDCGALYHNRHLISHSTIE